MKSVNRIFFVGLLFFNFLALAQKADAEILTKKWICDNSSFLKEPLVLEEQIEAQKSLWFLGSSNLEEPGCELESFGKISDLVLYKNWWVYKVKDVGLCKAQNLSQPNLWRDILEIRLSRLFQEKKEGLVRVSLDNSMALGPKKLVSFLYCKPGDL